MTRSRCVDCDWRSDDGTPDSWGTRCPRCGSTNLACREAAASASSSKEEGGGYDGEICDRCQRPVAESCPSFWHAPDALWNEVVGDAAGIRCVPCFTLDAAAAGVPVHWRALRQHAPETDCWCTWDEEDGCGPRIVRVNPNCPRHRDDVPSVSQQDRFVRALHVAVDALQTIHAEGGPGDDQRGDQAEHAEVMREQADEALNRVYDLTGWLFDDRPVSQQETGERDALVDGILWRLLGLPPATDATVRTHAVEFAAFLRWLHRTANERASVPSQQKGGGNVLATHGTGVGECPLPPGHAGDCRPILESRSQDACTHEVGGSAR